MKQKKLEKKAKSDGKKGKRSDKKLADREPKGEDTRSAKSSSVVSLGKLGRVES